MEIRCDCVVIGRWRILSERGFGLLVHADQWGCEWLKRRSGFISESGGLGRMIVNEMFESAVFGLPFHVRDFGFAITADKFTGIIN